MSRCKVLKKRCLSCAEPSSQRNRYGPELILSDMANLQQRHLSIFEPATIARLKLNRIQAKNLWSQLVLRPPNFQSLPSK